MLSSASAAVIAAPKSAGSDRQSSVIGPSTGTRPALSSAARASVPGLREFVSTAMFGPRGYGWVASTRTVWSIAGTVETSIRPACW